MTRCRSERKSGGRLIGPAISVAMATLGFLSDAAHADEDGVSFWLPGHFSSLAATPQVPGWRWTANRISVSGWRHAGISQSERIWRIRCGQPTGGMEYLGDVLDLAHGAHRHGSADTANSDEVRESPKLCRRRPPATVARRYLRPFGTITIHAKAVQ